MKHTTVPGSFNLHHAFWERKDYKTKGDRRFRRYPGLVIPTPEINHKLLHHNLTAPPKPHKRDMRDCMDYLEAVPDALKVERLWGIEKAAEFFGGLIISENEESFKARRIKEHLERQVGYLSLKLVDEAVALIA